MKKMQGFILVLLTLFLVGCGFQRVVSSSHPQIPWENIKAENIRAVKILSQNGQIRFDIKKPNDEKMIKQLVFWLNKSKGLGKENNEITPKGGVTTLFISLNDGLAYQILPAYSCLKNGNIISCKSIQGVVDFQVVGAQGEAQLQSSDLYQWLQGNKWMKY